VILGTNNGAVKLYGINPWEKDADMDVLIFPYEQINRLIPEFEKHGYQMSTKEKITNASECLWSNWINCGYYGFKIRSYPVELYGVRYMGSDFTLKMGLKNRLQLRIDHF